MAEVETDENIPSNDPVPGLNRVTSKNFHRRFSTVEEHVSELGGNKGRGLLKRSSWQTMADELSTLL